MAGRLVLAGTPIGNLGDVTARLADALREADVVFAEDTRRSRVLLDHLGVQAPLRSFFVGNEAERLEELRRRLEAGETVVLLTDAGMPAIADPGLTAVRVAQEVGATVTTVPGPSAVTAALAVSGLPADRFVFEGFLPRKGRDRKERLAELAREPRTIVVFLSPHRAGADLADLTDALGPDRAVTIARELTKRHEEVWSGTLGEAARRWAEGARGEFTVVVQGAPPEPGDLERAVAAARRRVAAGERPSVAARDAAGAEGVDRREVYRRLVDGDAGEAVGRLEGSGGGR